jgi:hypothetical protein
VVGAGKDGRMSFIVKPSRNPVVQAAFAGLKAAERAEKKQKPAPTPEPSKTPKSPRAKGGKTRRT